MAHSIPHWASTIVHRLARRKEDIDRVTIFERSAPILALCLFLVTIFTTFLSFFMQ